MSLELMRTRFVDFYVVGLRLLACWDSGFESRRGMDVCLLRVLCVVR